MYFVDFMQKTNMSEDRKEAMVDSLGGTACFSIFQNNNFFKRG